MLKSQKGKEVKPLKIEEDDDKNPNSASFTDTSYKLGGSGLEWRKVYQLFEKRNFEQEHYLEDFKGIKMLGFHKVATRPAIFPYNGMIRWIISHTNVKSCTIVNSSCVVVGSFKPKDIMHMYKLPIHQIQLYKEFLENFKAIEIVAKEANMEKLKEDWWDNSSPFKPSVTKLPTFMLKKPYRLVSTMICRLFGEKGQ